MPTDVERLVYNNEKQKEKKNIVCLYFSQVTGPY